MTRSRGLTMAFLAVCVVLAAMAVGASAAKVKHNNGRSQSKPTGARLDPSFGVNGSYAVSTNAPEYGVLPPSHLALAPDGESYVLQGVAISAFGADGRPDHSFGRNGRLRVTLGPGLLKSVAAVAVDSEGHVIVAGTYEPFPGYTNQVIKGSPKYPAKLPVTEAFVARYLADGSLDTSFGSDGVEVTNLAVPLPTDRPEPYSGKPPTAEYERPSLEVGMLLIDARNRPVIAGVYTAAIENCAYGNRFQEAFVARLTSDGAPDPTFGGKGFVKMNSESTEALAPGVNGELAMLTGSPTACGEHVVGTGPWTTSVLSEAGGPSPLLDPARPRILGDIGLAVDHKGRLIYAEFEGIPSTEEEIAAKVVRLLPDGDVDTSFGHGGGANLKQFKVESIGGIAVDAKNRIVVVFGQKRAELIRLGTAGKVDHSFARKGVLRVQIRNSDFRPEAVAIDSKGRIVVAGVAMGGSLNTGGGIGIARFLPGK